MSERFRKGLVFGALILAIAWGMYNYLPKSQSLQRQPALSPAEAAVVPASARLAAVEKSINVAEMKSKRWGEDPFRSLNKSTGAVANSDEPRWKLSGIVFNNLKPLAIINGKSVNVGDNVGKATVVEITQKSVVLDYGGSKVTLRVQKG